MHWKARSPDKRMQPTVDACPASCGGWHVLRSFLPAPGHRRCLRTEGNFDAASRGGTDRQAGVQAEVCSATAGNEVFGCTCRHQFELQRSSLRWQSGRGGQLACAVRRCLGPTGSVLTSCNQDFHRSPRVVAHVQLGWGARAGWGAGAVPLPAALRPRALGWRGRAADGECCLSNDGKLILLFANAFKTAAGVCLSMLKAFAVAALDVLDGAKLNQCTMVQPDSRQSQQLHVQGSGHCMPRYPRFQALSVVRALRFLGEQEDEVLIPTPGETFKEMSSAKLGNST